MSEFQFPHNDALLLGKDERPMVDTLGAPVHHDIVAPFCALQARAEKAGFALRIASGYRSFTRQLAIWNAKASGQRPLLDSAGQPLQHASLTAEELIAAIMRWSALPGASRHHWGSDIDVYDAAAVPAGYALQLSPQEVADDGPFGPLHRWLDEEFARGGGEGFFRPYHCDRGGIAPERWHLSYAPLSARLQGRLSAAVLAAALAAEEALLLREAVLAALPTLYQRYVAVPVEAYPLAFQSLLTNGEWV